MDFKPENGIWWADIVEEERENDPLPNNGEWTIVKKKSK
jgi:hypothetical protein